jgi:hypothetical protein
MKRLAALFLFLLLFIIPAGIAVAGPTFDTIVEAGEIVNNDIILFDHNLEIAEGALVNGDVILFNGDATVAGTIEGDLVLFNGDLTAESTAVVTGECVAMNGAVAATVESGLNCTDIERVPNFMPALRGMMNTPPKLSMPVERAYIHTALEQFVIGTALAIGHALLLGLLAFAVASLAPDHLRRVEATVKHKPVASGTVGLLTAVAVPSLIALLLPVSIILTFVCIGLLGFPIMFALSLGLVAGVLLGWITVGDMVGQWLIRAFNLRSRTLPVTTALGTIILTFFMGLLSALPFVFGEGFIIFLIASIGLGAVALTQFGAKSYPVALVGQDEAKVAAVLETLPVEEPSHIEANK